MSKLEILLLKAQDAMGLFSTAETEILKLQWACFVLLLLVLASNIAILWNQRKIKKQLRQLLEQKETNEADKPQE